MARSRQRTVRNEIAHATYAAAAATSAAAVTDAARAASAKERAWQFRRLPKHLRPIAFPARSNN